MCHALDMGKFIMEKYSGLRTLPRLAGFIHSPIEGGPRAPQVLGPTLFACESSIIGNIQKGLLRVQGRFYHLSGSIPRRMLGRIGMTIMFTAPLNSFMKFGYENGLDSEKDSSARGGQSMRQGNSRTPTDMLAKVNVQSESSDADDLSSFTKANTINLHGQLPIEWWYRKEQRLAYPRFHWMAIDILSIPPIPDELARVFSGARRTISWDRHNLTSKNVEMIESLASWIKEGIVGHLDVDASLEELVAGMELSDDDESE